MSIADPAIELEQTLRSRFGLENFRPGQRDVIENVLAGRDVLCVMPTGGGKSLCYQLPALLLPGLTLVVSPLIALMKDQVDALIERGLRATLLNSTLDPSEQYARLAEIEAGQYNLVYVAPERFRSHRFVEAMNRIRPSLLAVDEAHCISEWGHDFRPDYARIGLARRQIGSPPCIALTATATDLVRRDIADQLDLQNHAQFVTGFDRPNLSYAVVEAQRDHDKFAALAETLGRESGSAIIYASSRKKCEAVGQYLEKEMRRKVVVYHAGLTREERTEAQERFMTGRADVVVATNAFGMGVDKSDIRKVIHFNLPGTLEAYYQEAGRAGRDGKPADCLLLFASGDRFLQEMFIENEYPPPDAVYRVYEFLRGLDADPIELTHAEIRESARLDLNESAVGTTLKILEGAGAVERFRPRENMAIVRINAEADEPSLIDRVSPNASVQLVVVRGVEGLVNRRFGESIYFHPDDFAGRLGLDRSSLTRALKVLANELPIDYVPPFRGNAVRVLDRSRRARDLVINFQELEKKKQREYDKLERMIKYAQSNKCRRSFILGYFGDLSAAECGRCDNCGPMADRPQTPTCLIDNEAGREVLLKVLSGIARARGKFGKVAIALMLIGSKSEKMSKLGLNRLSTFGILNDFNQAEVTTLIDALAAAGMVDSTDVDRFRPVIDVSEAGREYLKTKGTAPLSMALSEPLFAKVRNGGLQRLMPRPAPKSVVGPLEDVEPDASSEESVDPLVLNDPLYSKLKAMRLQWSREMGQSAFLIFTNKILETMVHCRPKTPHELASIKGFRPVIRERYGSALLAAINEADAGPDIEPTRERRPTPLDENLTDSRRDPAKVAGPRPEPKLETPKSIDRLASVHQVEAPTSLKPVPTSAKTRTYVPTEEWTWRLLDQGFSLDDAAAIRGLEPGVIVRHATLMARKGKAIPLDRWLSAQVMSDWIERYRRGELEPPPGSEDPDGLWPLFLACRASHS